MLPLDWKECAEGAVGVASPHGEPASLPVLLAHLSMEHFGAVLCWMSLIPSPLWFIHKL